MGRDSNCDPVVTAASSQAAGGPCGEQGRSLSRQVCKSLTLTAKERVALEISQAVVLP